MIRECRHQFASFIGFFSRVTEHWVSFGRRESTLFQSAFFQCKTQLLLQRCTFWRSHWRETSTTKPNPAATCSSTSASSLLLPLRWKTPNTVVIFLVADYFCFKIKELTWHKVIGSIDTGGKERKEKCLRHFGPVLKLTTLTKGKQRWNSCPGKALLAEHLGWHKKGIQDWVVQP